MSKRDRQGVRTPAQLEQKYSFGSDQRAVLEMQRKNAALEKKIAECRSQIALALTRASPVRARIENTSDAWSLSGITYEDLRVAYEEGRRIALYAAQSDGERCYVCMGSASVGGVPGLIFWWAYDAAAESVFVGSDGSVSVTAAVLVVE